MGDTILCEAHYLAHQLGKVRDGVHPHQSTLRALWRRGYVTGTNYTMTLTDAGWDALDRAERHLREGSQ